MRHIRQLAKELDIPLPESDDLAMLQTIFRAEIKRRLKDITVNRRLCYEGRRWIVESITPARAGRKGKMYILHAADGAGRLEISETTLLRGIQ